MSNADADSKSPVSPSTDIVDAVFVIGTGSQNNNEELKYALRNLERNCPFVRDVYISGECPAWVDKSVVKHLQWPDRFKHAKDANIIDKLRHACEQEGIAKKILFCSDDQFQTRQCTWEDFEPRWLRKYTSSDDWYEGRKRLWHTRLRKTLERDRMRRAKEGLDQTNVYYYQPHIWMPIDRDSFIEYAKWSDYEHRDDTIIASGYFNFVDAGGKPNFDHVFITAGQKWPVKATHIAYTDSSFQAAMKYLRQEYPRPSRFEVNYAAKALAPVSAPVSSPIPKSPVEHRTDLDIIEDLKSRVNANEVWSGLRFEIDVAESLRTAEFNGWRKVWNDIIRRWNTTTDKGKLYLPVTMPPSDEAKSIVDMFKATHPNGVKAPEPTGKKCTKCEERRRKAEEERKAKMAASVPIPPPPAPKPADKPILIGRPVPVSRSVPRPIPRPVPAKEPGLNQGCLDCAMDHLAVAVAYLGSNAGRPERLDIQLAKGEVQVASQHLLALGRHEEYNRCVEALDSVYSERSIFSEATFKDILGKLTDNT